jgi:hypothetical protein
MSIEKSIHATFALAALLTGLADRALAQIWTDNYHPTNTSQMYSSGWRYKSFALPYETILYTNIWAPHNAAGSRHDDSGHLLPMGMQTNVHDSAKRHWNVVYDVSGPLPANSPYYLSSVKYSWVKAFPHVSYKPDNLHVWEGGGREFQGHWHLGANSSNWANNRFNAIWELRLARYDSSGNKVYKSEYIIQLEMMQSNYGTPGAANTSLAGHQWTPGQFKTVASTNSPQGVPVYKYILSGAGVNVDTSRTFDLDLFPFLQHTALYPNRFGADYPADFNRASWNARVESVKAGVEVCNGTGSKVWTGRYWVGTWAK